MIQHFLEFVTSGHGEKEILEPGKFKDAEFLIEQSNGRLGRDAMALGAGDVALELYASQPDHYFDLIMENNDFYGSNAVVKYKLKIDGSIAYIGQVDFATLKTDERTKVEFNVIEETEKQLFKRNFDIKTNLFSDTTLNEETITPVSTSKVLLKAKPITGTSKWTNPTIGRQLLFNNPPINSDYFNPIKNQEQYEIRDSVTWLFDTNDAEGGAFVNFVHIDAKTNLSDINIEVKLELVIDYLPNFENSLDDKNGQIGLRLYYGQSNLSYAQQTLWDSIVFEGQSDLQQTVSTTVNFTIPFINNTDKIWISFVSGTNNGAVIRVTFNECSSTITASSIAYNTVVPMVRLIDAMKYNALSSASLPVSAPRWEMGGEFYDQYITTQALMRNLTDKPFNLSTKDIVDDYLPEVFGDYQIQPDSTVFYGRYPDFYRNYEIGNFSNNNLIQRFGQFLGQIVGYSKDKNQSYLLKKFNYKYKNFQSQKENQEGNTYDVVHGDTQWYNRNNELENTKTVEVGFIRDPFMIEDARRKGYDLSNKTATQDDDKIYIVDIVELQDSDRQFTETATLEHRASQVDFNLELKNNQTFSWILLGIEVGSTFSLVAGLNTGIYTVTAVSDTVLNLVTTGGFPQNIGIVNTTFTYRVGNSVTLTNRTSEGFEQIENISDANKFGNLRFTVKRNIINYYSQYLASTLLFNPVNYYINSLYSNNPEATTQLEGGLVIKEAENFTPTGAILDGFEYKVKIVMTLADFLSLMTIQREQNGYISTFDSNGLPLKGFIKKGTWVFETAGTRTAETFTGIADFTLESMYQPFYIQIFGNGNGMIVLSNGEGANDFNFYIENKKLYIFDETGKQLFVPVPFNRVKINNSTQAATPEQLEQWLNLLKQ